MSKSVDIVHTQFSVGEGLPEHQMSRNLGGGVQQVAGACGDPDDEVEAFICGEAVPVTVDPDRYAVGRDTPAAFAATATGSPASSPSQNAKRTLNGDHGLPIAGTPQNSGCCTHRLNSPNAAVWICETV